MSSGKIEIIYNDGTVFIYKNGSFVGEYFCEYHLPLDLENLLEQELTRYNVGSFEDL